MARDITKIVDEEKRAKRRNAILRNAIGLVVMVSMFLIYFAVNNGFAGSKTWKEMSTLLSNGFFLSGGITLGAGLLVFVANEGQFYFLSYTVKRILSKFVHSIPEATMTYGDYVAARKGKRTPFGFLIILGLVFVAMAAIFAGISMNIPVEK